MKPILRKKRGLVLRSPWLHWSPGGWRDRAGRVWICDSADSLWLPMDCTRSNRLVLRDRPTPKSEAVSVALVGQSGKLAWEHGWYDGMFTYSVNEFLRKHVRWPRVGSRRVFYVSAEKRKLPPTYNKRHEK